MSASRLQRNVSNRNANWACARASLSRESSSAREPMLTENSTGGVKSILDRQIGNSQPRHETTAVPPGTTTPAGISNTLVAQRSVANGCGGKRPWLPRWTPFTQNSPGEQAPCSRSRRIASGLWSGGTTVRKRSQTIPSLAGGGQGMSAPFATRHAESSNEGSAQSGLSPKW